MLVFLASVCDEVPEGNKDQLHNLAEIPPIFKDLFAHM